MAEWKIATGRNACRRGRARDAPLAQGSATGTEDPWTVAEIESSLKGIRRSVRQSCMFGQNLSRLKATPEIAESGLKAVLVCGLGTLSRRQSRYQFAFLLELLSAFPGLQDREAFDPQFTETDVRILWKSGITVLSENDRCRRQLAVPSLVFFPHLPMSLLENFFVANIENSQLYKSVVICNSLSKIAKGSARSADAPKTALEKLSASGRVHELPLVEADLANATAFNDLLRGSHSMTTGRDLYRVLGLTANATDIEVRRAYRTLVSTAHPDKGGDPRRFSEIQQAYTVLSDRDKRRYYDATGEVEKTPDEEFMDVFADGKFRDCSLAEQQQTNVEEQIAIRNSDAFRSHSAGFEAWMRSRGSASTEVYTAETIANNFGVTKSSYDDVRLSPALVHQVQISEAVRDVDSLSVSTTDLATSLEWGEVLVEMKYAAMHPADFYTARTGSYGYDKATFPYFCGHDGIGVVAKTGPGVTSVSENDWVMPYKPFFGSWRSLAITKASELLKVPASLAQMEYGAVLKEMCLAYRLIEDHGNLKPGDWVVVNAANSTVGQIVIQLCRLLHLKCIAVVRPREPQKQELLKKMLLHLGASLVLTDDDAIKAELQKLKYSAKPKLALDCVGGSSTLRLTDSLAEGGELVIYGCMSGNSPTWNWKSWVFRNIKVSGFNLRKWTSAQPKSRLIQMLEALTKLINGKKLDVNYTEYNFPSEFEEAVCHSISNAKDTKVILKFQTPPVEQTEG